MKLADSGAMYIRIMFVASGMVLALHVAPGQAPTGSGTPDPHARELAQALVASEGGRSRFSTLNSMELVLTDQIDRALEIGDPVRKKNIALVVHNSFVSLEDDLIDARVSAVARTYTIKELQGALAFERSPTGQALRRAAPELNRELMSAVLDQDAPKTDTPRVSEQKAALINRILKARDVENSARKGWRTNVAMSKAFSEASNEAAPSAESLNESRSKDAYARRFLAIESQFYARTFSDEQLLEMAAYFEGPTGRAFRTRAPQLMSAATSMAPEIFDRLFQRLNDKACEVVDCTVAQRAALGVQLAQVRSAVAAGGKALVH